MKNKLFISIGIIIALSLLCLPVFAEEEPSRPPLFFRSVNAGYKDDQSAQNYDFFELAKAPVGDLDISPYKIQYFNSSDNLSGELEFAEPTILRGDIVVFGFNKSPQYVDQPSRYLYNFSSSGLASTAGRLRIIQEETIVDEICWGKTTCAKQLPKFATTIDQNRTAIICAKDDCEEQYSLDAYYPAIVDSIYIPAPEPVAPTSCAGLQITELYAYYEDNSAEQYIELYNSNQVDQDLSACRLRYKNKEYPLQGNLVANSYTIIQDILLTKNPSSTIAIDLLDGNGVVSSVQYSHGQKKGTSFALIDGQ